MHPAIAQHRASIAAICLRYRISRLEVFGSAARADDFDPANSDADFLVEHGIGKASTNGGCDLTRNASRPLLPPGCVGQ